MYDNITTGSSDERLARDAAGGDKAALDFLLTKYRSLVKHIARGYFIPGGEREDLEQEGMFGLYQAVMSFDETKSGSAPFYFFAALCVRRRIVSAIRKAERHDDLPIQDCPEPAHPGPSPEETLINKENLDCAKHLLTTKLSRLELSTLLLFLSGFHYKEIASVLNRSPKSVDNALQRIRRKLST